MLFPPKPTAEIGPSQDVRGMIFDLGDVLFDATVWRRWLHRLLRRFDVHAPYHSLFRDWEEAYLADVYCGRRDYEAAFAEFLGEWGLSAGQIVEVATASRAQRRDLSEQTRLYPGVAGTLAELKSAGLRLAVMANSTRRGDELRTMLGRLGVGPVFDVVQSSMDVGVLNPSAESSRKLHDELGLSVGEAIYVGHDAKELVAARRLGIPTVAFNYRGGTIADRHVEHFRDLAHLVSTPQVRRAA